MAGTATVQFTMDADLKKQAEALYAQMGTNLEDVLRVLVEQSVGMHEHPLIPAQEKKNRKSVAELSGCLHQYAKPELLAQEDEVLRNAFERAVLEKYAEKYGVELDDSD